MCYLKYFQIMCQKIQVNQIWNLPLASLKNAKWFVSVSFLEWNNSLE